MYSTITVIHNHSFVWLNRDNIHTMLKCNKYICILSIAVTTLLYITTKYDYHIWYVHRTCLQGSGCNSYQGHVNDSGEFWRVLGCPCVRYHWKCDIVDTFTHHFCANGHGWVIGTSQTYIRKSVKMTPSPVQYICAFHHLLLAILRSTLYNAQHLYQRWALDLVCCALCCATHNSLLLQRSPHCKQCHFYCHLKTLLFLCWRWHEGQFCDVF